MTGRLEMLIFTDCRAGEGLEGGAGLQFQARSPAADEQAMAVVRADLLYQPSDEFMRTRRAVADFPPSFAYVCDTIMAASAGVYLGKEASGHRQGNQLTHCVFSPDAAAYAKVRPAQLFGARFWRDRPADGTALPPLEAGWVPGPLTAELVQQEVRALPGGEAMLQALLTAVEAVLREPSSARRVLLLARDLRDVMVWLAAATLLLPQEVALTAGFRAFVANPTVIRQPIMAVHADDNPSGVTVDNDLGYHVFDVDTGRHSQPAPSPYAQTWARLFLTEDAYDVVDAVELAAVSGLGWQDAARLAMTVVSRRPPAPADVPLVVQWLRTGPPDLIALHGPRLARGLRDDSGTWPPAVLAELDDLARRGVVEVDAPAVRLALLADEVRRAVAENRVDATVLAPIGRAWTAEHQRTVVATLTSAAATASPRQFEALQRLARRFGVAPRVGEITGAMEAFARDWIANTHAGYLPDQWPNRAAIEERVRVQLERSDPLAHTTFLCEWWWLLLDTDLSPSLRQATTRAVLGTGDRLSTIQRFIRAAKSRPQAVSSLAHLTREIWAGQPLTLGDAVLLTGPQGLPRNLPLPPEMFDELAHRLMFATELSADDLNIGYRFADHGTWRPSQAVMRLFDEEARLQLVLTEIESNQPTEAVISQTVAGVGDRVLRAHMSRVLRTMLFAPAVISTTTLLKAKPSLVVPLIADLAPRVGGDTASPNRIALAFVLSAHNLSAEVGRAVSDDARLVLANGVRVWLRADKAIHAQHVNAATDQISFFGPPWTDTWRRTVRAERPRGRGLRGLGGWR